ncbi:MAG TPA: DNA polymerase III subunit beta [Thermotogaceae bacterium]|nr:DNA polymerase III subunit beta [Thermotogota bacterium]HEW92162.1 DNA polymerase III subunit beta [Thermotogaceae bacterium]
MKILVDKSKLENAVMIAARAVAPKTVKPVLSGILFEIDERLNFYSTDLEMGLKHSVDLDEANGEKFKFVLDAKLISEVVRSLPEDKIEISFDGNVVEIRSGRSIFKLNTMSADEFPEFVPTETGFKIRLSSENVKNMMEKVIFCASTDEYMRNLNGVFWEFDGPYLRLVAADGFRLALVEESIENEETLSFFLSLKSMKELQKILDSATDEEFEMIYDGAKVGFKLDDTQIVIRIVDTEFPDYKKVIPTGFSTKVTANKVELREAIRRAAITARLGDESIKFNIFDNSMHIESKSQDYGEAHEELEVEKDGQDMMIAFNPKFILEAIQRIETENVELNFLDPTKPLQINPPEVLGYLYIIMPLRL